MLGHFFLTVFTVGRVDTFIEVGFCRSLSTHP